MQVCRTYTVEKEKKTIAKLVGKTAYCLFKKFKTCYKNIKDTLAGQKYSTNQIFTL